MTRCKTIKTENFTIVISSNKFDRHKSKKRQIFCFTTTLTTSTRVRYRSVCECSNELIKNLEFGIEKSKISTISQSSPCVLSPSLCTYWLNVDFVDLYLKMSNCIPWLHIISILPSYCIWQENRRLPRHVIVCSVFSP